MYNRACLQLPPVSVGWVGFCLRFSPFLPSLCVNVAHPRADKARSGGNLQGALNGSKLEFYCKEKLRDVGLSLK